VSATQVFIPCEIARTSVLGPRPGEHTREVVERDVIGRVFQSILNKILQQRLENIH